MSYVFTDRLLITTTCALAIGFAMKNSNIRNSVVDGGKIIIYNIAIGIVFYNTIMTTVDRNIESLYNDLKI